MKKLFVLIAFAALAGLFFINCQRDSNPVGTALSEGSVLTGEGPTLAGGKGKGSEGAGCQTIQDGTILAALYPHDVIVLGYDDWGYNYQAHMFNGMLSDYRRGNPDFPDWSEIKLMMKWNDAWLSNMDCGTQPGLYGGPYDDLDQPDEKLDRHYPLNSYIGSGAWLTNHQSGIVDGKKRTYFVKLVAVPDDAELIDGIWYNTDGGEIGPEIWDQFAIIQEQGYGFDLDEPGEVWYRSPVGPGFGKYKAE